MGDRQRTADKGCQFPYFGSHFDFWPAGSVALDVVFGVSGDGRPEDADEIVESVAGYLATALWVPPQGDGRRLNEREAPAEVHLQVAASGASAWSGAVQVRRCSAFVLVAAKV